MNSDLIRQEYRQIFQADLCQLRNFDARDFSQKMGKRKLIMVGDSLMRLNFYSLACLMKSEVSKPSAASPLTSPVTGMPLHLWGDSPFLKCSMVSDRDAL